MTFSKISSIDIENKATWSKALFLTFDIDWAPDFVMEETMDIIGYIPATFFVTHNSTLINQIKKMNHIECGIHPNFNPLLNGDLKYGGNIADVLDYYLGIVPNAVSIRSHSMTQSSHILDIAEKKGLKYDCNHFIPFESRIDLNPYRWLNTNLIKAPYFWEDDVYFITQNGEWDITCIDKLLNCNLKIFDFHPIHVYLNTEHMDRYEAAKPYMNDAKKLKEFINTKTYGTRDFLKELIKYEK